MVKAGGQIGGCSVPGWAISRGPDKGHPLLWGQGSRKARGLACLEEAGSADKTQDTQVNLNLRHAENDFYVPGSVWDGLTLKKRRVVGLPALREPAISAGGIGQPDVGEAADGGGGPRARRGARGTAHADRGARSKSFPTAQSFGLTQGRVPGGGVAPLCHDEMWALPRGFPRQGPGARGGGQVSGRWAGGRAAPLPVSAHPGKPRRSRQWERPPPPPARDPPHFSFRRHFPRPHPLPRPSRAPLFLPGPSRPLPWCRRGNRGRGPARRAAPSRPPASLPLSPRCSLPDLPSPCTGPAALPEPSPPCAVTTPPRNPGPTCRWSRAVLGRRWPARSGALRLPRLPRAGSCQVRPGLPLRQESFRERKPVQRV